MAGKLRREIQQTKPFTSVQEEVVLSMLRTADQLAVPMNELLRQENLSLSQYNILRILRGAGDDGLACGGISERMVRRDPDLTRLLDRLESRGLLVRARGTADRRVVRSVISDEGLRLLGRLDDAISTAVKETLAHMPRERLRLLRDLLEEARSGAG